MPKFTLTPQQKTNLEARHKQSRDARECDRIKVVLLRSEGWSAPSIAQALRISEFTISRYLDDYLKKDERWDIQYTVSGLNKWLHQSGFTYKKPKGTPHKADVNKQAEFVEHYETLKASLPADEALLFMDAVHPTQATKITSGWIRKGVDKIINTTGSRTRLNIVGAIELNNLSAAVFDQFKTVNGEAIIAFFRKIRSAYASMSVIHIVLAYSACI